MKDDSVFLNHILDAINQIEEYITGMTYDDFLENRLVQDAVVRQLEIIGEATNVSIKLLELVYSVVRQLEIIGEATKNLSSTKTEEYPQIPWKEIAGMRDKLIHAYFGVDLEEVWNTAKRDIPYLKEILA
ncbi:MAG: DUF86 domain-containing protein [Methanolobus sp.]|nr:DUF86 domain-containing protein [Methanolobus sp.]